MAFLFVLVILGVIVAVAVSKHSKAINAVWDEAARRLDLRFQAGSDMAIRGIRPTMNLLVQKKSVGKSRWTEYIATFKNALPLEIQLRPRGYFSGVTNSLFSRVDIEIGDAIFDAGILIEGSDPERVREFLDPEAVRAIKRLIARFDEFEINHRGITVLRSRVTNIADQLVADVELLEKIALLLVHKARGEGAGEGKKRPTIPVPPPIPGRDDVEEKYGVKKVPPPLPSKMEMRESDESDESDEFVEPTAIVPDAAGPGSPPGPDPEPQTTTDSSVGPGLSAAEEKVAAEEPEMLSIPRSPVVEEWLLAFSESDSRYGFSKIFETDWKDREVEGEAVLESVETFSMDRVFGRGPGHRLAFTLGILENGEVLRLVSDARPGAETGALRSLIGESIPFGGTVVRCDAFCSTLFLKTPVPEESPEAFAGA